VVSCPGFWVDPSDNTDDRSTVPKINVTTDDGELVEQIDINDEYDLTSPIHRIHIKDLVMDALKRAVIVQAKSEGRL